MKRRILSWILAACLTVGMVTVAAAAPTPTEAAQSETMKTAASPWEKVSFADIYNDPNKFSTISNAENGNIPKIDESVQSLGWLGTGACVAVKGFGFGAGTPDGVQLKVEMSRDLGEIEGAYHFAVYAVPSGQSVTGAGDLTEGQKIAVQPVLPPSQDHTRYFIQTYDVPAEILQAPVDLYFLCGTGGFNLKSVQFTRPQTPITVDKENAMIYTEAASQFDQALPLGNGFVGAMVYGGVDTERIGLNEATIWTGSPYENNVEGAYQALEQLRQQTANGAASWTGSFIDSQFMDATAYGPTFTGSQKYQLAGELNLKTNHSASEYVRYLDLDTATAVTQYRWDDSLITREYFVSNPDRVMAMRLTSDGAPMTFTGSYDLKGMVERGRTVEGNDTLVIQGGVSDYRTVESGIAFTVRVKFLPADGELSTEDNTITVSNTTDCTVLVTIATNFKAYNDITGDADALAKDTMDAADDKSYEELKSAHIADYQALYNRVELDLGGSLNGRTVEEARQALADRDDPAFVELSYNFNRYLQIAASREGTQPTNLQGIWNDQLRPMWDCNYTTNINLQMNYWATLSNNLEECYAPMIDKLKSLQAQGHETAKELYGITTEGAWTLHHNTDLWSITGPVAGDWGMTPTCGAWLANEAYTVYRYNQDAAYLREIYPVIKGAAQFLLEFLVEDENGQLIFCPSSSPENANKATGAHVAYNSAFDIQITHELFSNVMEAAEILGQDASLVEQLNTAMEKLPPVVGIGSWGQVQEFYGYDGDQQTDTHRHLSHLYGLFPGTSITADDAAAWNAAYRTLEARSANNADETGWGIAWRILLYTRFGDSDRAYTYLKTMYDMTYRNCRENLFTVCSDVFQYDANGGMLAAVTNLLVEDQEGAALLKGLPEQWQNGTVKGLRLKGDFTLDEMTWENGILQTAVITSHSGQPLTVSYGKRTVTLDTEAGKTYTFDAALGQGETDCTASAALRVTGQQPEGASEFSLCLKEASGVATAAVTFTTTENDVRVTGRNGFTAFGMKSKDLGNGTFEKTVYLSYLAHPGENFCCTTETEVAAIWVGRERATVTIQSMAISGYDVSGTARPGTVTGIDPDTATGGAMLDVTEAQRYYRAEAGDANWDEAMAYDTNDDQRIDLLDLTHILLTSSEASTEA